MIINQKSTKDEILSSAVECIDSAQSEIDELLRQRNALLIVVAILATMLTAF